MEQHALAGKKALSSMLVNVPRLISAYYVNTPDMEVPEQHVEFGTSGHRGSSFTGSFTESHIHAITQAICDYRQEQGFSGPLFIGFDTHALSEPAFISAVEVLAGNGVDTRMAAEVYTTTPAISLAILEYNRGRKEGWADGIVITPSHNPPDSGGFKYNPPSGGPADTAATRWIAKQANQYLRDKNRKVRRKLYEQARRDPKVQGYDFITPYVEGLAGVLDMEAVGQSGLRMCADALGGAGLSYWPAIAERYGLTLDLRNAEPDPTFRFMTVDGDGAIRMDCSSPWAMAGLIELKHTYDLAFGNDPDFDRHGIVTPSAGLLNPNHYLAVAIDYLFRNRSGWSPVAAVGKTLVSSSLIDRVAAGLDRTLAEVPVGFKWFVDGLLDGSFGFGGEESAGASFLRKDGTVWTTDKDGILLCLLAAEMTARTGKEPGELFAGLAERYGMPVYARMEAPATPAQKEVMAHLTAEQVQESTLAGEKITAKLTTAPFGGAGIGGLKVITQNGWFAARPSGTEDIYKIYAESFLGEEHLRRIQEEAQVMVNQAFSQAGL